jgi:hypothetical protein
MNPNVQNTQDRNLNICYGSYVNMSEDTPIYKVMEFEYAYTMLKEGILRVGKIQKWEDPFENFLLKQNFWYKTKEGEHQVYDIHDISELLYGQSWTLTDESDAMWRIYSPNKTSVRIKTTIGKLFDAIYTNDACSSTTFIGVVNYCSQVSIQEYLDKLQKEGITLWSLGSTRNMVNPLLNKRDTFEHEKEVRILYIAPSEEKEKCLRNDFIKYPIQINDLVEEICFDPRVGEDLFEAHSIALKEIGFCNNIVKSSLYDLGTKRNIEVK